MVGELCSVEVTLTDLTLYDDFGTFSFNVLKQLGAGHMLVIFMVANVAAKLGALVHGMLLQFSHGLPKDNFLSILPAFVRELTKVNAVSEYFVDRLKEITSLLAMWAADIETGCHPWSHTGTHVAHLSLPIASLFPVRLGRILLSLTW